MTSQALPQPQGQPLNEFIQQSQPQNQQCYIRTCDQIITGRNLLYARALEIVQDEEYLSEAELNLIRRYKRQTITTNALSTPTNFGNLSLVQLLDQLVSSIPEALKAQFCELLSNLFMNLNFFSTLQTAVDSGCDNIQTIDTCTKTTKTVTVDTGGNIVSSSRPNTITTSDCTVCQTCSSNVCAVSFTTYPGPTGPITTTVTADCSATATSTEVPNFFTGGTVDLTNNEQCKSYIFNLYFFILTYLYSRICLFDGFLDFLTEAAPIVGVGAGTVAAAGLYMTPTLTMTLPSGVPAGNPQPGTPGGGAPPTTVASAGVVPASAQTLSTALALVPLGLTAVAVFPPYNTPRTIPAVSVIFAEDPAMVPGMRRKKRSLRKLRYKVYKFFLLNRKKLDHLIYDVDLFIHEVKYFLTKELTIQYLKEKIHHKIYYVKEKMAELKNNFMCLKARLRMYAWQKKKKHKPYNHYGKREIVNRYEFHFCNFDTCLTFGILVWMIALILCKSLCMDSARYFPPKNTV